MLRAQGAGEGMPTAPTPPLDLRIFDAPEQAAFEVLGESVAIFDDAVISAAFGTPPRDGSGVDLGPLEVLDECIDGLSRVLAESLIDGRASNIELRSAMRDADLAAEPVLIAMIADRDDVLFEHAADARTDRAATMLRRAALEDFRVNLLTGAVNGRYGSTWEHVDDAFVARILVRYVYDRAEVFTTHELLPFLEMRACEWYFDCWSPSSILGVRQHGVRQRAFQELLLLDRPSMRGSGPTLRTFLATTPTLSASPRQHRVAEELLRAVPGVFTPVATNGNAATLEHVGDGRRFEVLLDEYGREPAPAYVGRIFPHGGRWLPTPDFDRLSGDPTSEVIDLARAMIEVLPPRYPATLIEAARAIARGTEVPVPAPGSSSLSESAMLLDLVEGLVRDEELLQPGAGAQTPPSWPRCAAQPDEIFGQWWATIEVEAATAGRVDDLREEP
jgi:hypothetical protein